LEKNMYLRLSHTCRCVNESSTCVAYQGFYKAAGHMPAHRDETRTRWLIKADDLPVIAAAFGKSA
jgi:hypothetical protein